MKSVEAEDANRMAYKTMPMSYYLIASLIYYAAIVVGSITIPGIDIVFDFLGAIAITAIAFFFPAYLYPKAVKKFNVPIEGEIVTNIRLCCFFMFIGFICFALGMFSSIYAIVKGG